MQQNSRSNKLCCFCCALNGAIQRPCTEWRRLSDILGDNKHRQGNDSVAESSFYCSGGYCGTSSSVFDVGGTTLASSWQRIPHAAAPAICLIPSDCNNPAVREIPKVSVYRQTLDRRSASEASWRQPMSHVSIISAQLVVTSLQIIARQMISLTSSGPMDHTHADRVCEC